MRAVAHGLTSIGCGHLGGEECVASWSMLDANTGLGVLADSISSFEGGSMASSLVVDTMIEVAQEQFAEGSGSHFVEGSSSNRALGNPNTRFKRLLPILEIAGQEANLNIRRAKADYPEYQDMATTVLAVAMNRENAIIVHAGNARCYRINLDEEPAICQLTRDDTLLQALVERRALVDSDASGLLYRSMLTKALGTESTVRFASRIVDIAPNDYLLLCSDALYNSVGPHDMKACLMNDWSIQEKADQLIERSLQHGLADSRSVVLMQV